ncbi:hypothetical protein LCGC14_1422450 [marine sediment metagenome]|uniref:Uncharacterized protein n=1 Tax=marine sediment metagenome TaxID=412755 RepID=A0A0F9M6E8_9ZZZZ
MRLSSDYVCHSGGCPGADMTWETLGDQYNVTTIAYSFPGHHHQSTNPKILTPDELAEGMEHVITANHSLKKPISETWPPIYVQNLLARNWFQVKNSDRVYAIGRFMDDEHKLVNGGTGWTVQMAVDNDKVVHFFDQNINSWFRWKPGYTKFLQADNTPQLTIQFAGVGTRAINDNGVDAIKHIFDYNFNILL